MVLCIIRNKTKLAVGSGHTDLGQVSHVVVYTGMDERTNKLTFNFFCMLADKSTITQISVPGNSW